MSIERTEMVKALRMVADQLETDPMLEAVVDITVSRDKPLRLSEGRLVTTTSDVRLHLES